jgi:hypothetical protein
VRLADLLHEKLDKVGKTRSESEKKVEKKVGPKALEKPLRSYTTVPGFSRNPFVDKDLIDLFQISGVKGAGIIRKDRKGNAITRGGRRHQITFRDELTLENNEQQ